MPKLPLIQLSVKSQNILQEMRCWIKQGMQNKLGLRNTLGDRIIITDEVLVWEGSMEQVKNGTAKLKFKSKGHIVSQGLIGIINLLALYTLNSVNAVPSYNWGAGAGNIYSRIRVGTGTGATTASMTDLVTPNTTNPSSLSGATSNPTAGVYRVSWLATWNAGVLTAITVTELGLYLFLVPTLQTFGATGPLPTVYAFCSRLSDSDGDFTAFLVNILVPLTIEWRLTFTFA